MYLFDISNRRITEKKLNAELSFPARGSERYKVLSGKTSRITKIRMGRLFTQCSLKINQFVRQADLTR